MGILEEDGEDDGDDGGGDDDWDDDDDDDMVGCFLMDDESMLFHSSMSVSVSVAIARSPIQPSNFCWSAPA